MTDRRTFIIVGGGLAGAKGAEALRHLGFDGRIVLLGEEQVRPYERPPLSKGYLLGTTDIDAAFVHPYEWYEQHEVDLRLGVGIRAVDTASRAVVASDGDVVRYDELLLATGATPQPLPVPGGDHPDVTFLRTMADSERLRRALAAATRVLIAGGGWIGLEVAAAARRAGVEVVLVEWADLPLLRVLGPEVARTFADLHRDHGVDLRVRTRVREVIDAGAGVTATLSDGRKESVDLMVVGIGAFPNDALARTAGLTVDDGVIVDEHLQSSDPHVWAAGDVARAYHPLLGRHVRVEHWANALNQPAVAAANMLGQGGVYDRVPYFYSDQYHLGMEYSGHVAPGSYDQVVIRGDQAAMEFVAFWLRDNHVLAGCNVNVWDVTDDIQALVRSDHPVDPELLAYPDVPLATLVR